MHTNEEFWEFFRGRLIKKDSNFTRAKFLEALSNDLIKNIESADEIKVVCITWSQLPEEASKHLSLRLRIDEEREQPAKHCKRIAKETVEKYSYE
jgi:hypothetical protein